MNKFLVNPSIWRFLPDYALCIYYHRIYIYLLTNDSPKTSNYYFNKFNRNLIHRHKNSQDFLSQIHALFFKHGFHFMELIYKIITSFIIWQFQLHKEQESDRYFGKKEERTDSALVYGNVSTASALTLRILHQTSPKIIYQLGGGVKNGVIQPLHLTFMMWCLIN
jgi:hypothetical protein